MAVYQQRPWRRWEELFAGLAARLDYAPNAHVVYEANLAFLVLFELGARPSGWRVRRLDTARGRRTSELQSSGAVRAAISPQAGPAR